MFSKSFILTSLMAASALGYVFPGQRRCEAEPDDEHKENARLLSIEEDKQINDGKPCYENELLIPTVFHVISEGNSTAEGAISDQSLQDQLRVLNSAYYTSGVQFDLIKTTHTINAAWANNHDQLAKFKALREGDYGTLNIYFQKDLGPGLLGHCEFPSSKATPGSDKFFLDGCKIKAATIPGSGNTAYGEGKTAVHEVGHWLNLFHPWQTGCGTLGDFVRDTPTQAHPNYGCPDIDKIPDTCPGQEGLDNVYNYMDYSDDICLSQFTDGQARRMHNSYSKWRAN